MNKVLVVGERRRSEGGRKRCGENKTRPRPVDPARAVLYSFFISARFALLCFCFCFCFCFCLHSFNLLCSPLVIMRLKMKLPFEPGLTLHGSHIANLCIHGSAPDLAEIVVSHPMKGTHAHSLSKPRCLTSGLHLPAASCQTSVPCPSRGFLGALGHKITSTSL